MFTGIIEEVGHIITIDRQEVNARLEIKANFSNRLMIGDSIAVNGVCMTAEKQNTKSFSVFASVETLQRTNLGRLKPHDPVNLERAISADGRFNGHIVQGHVDGFGIIQNIIKYAEAIQLIITVPEGQEKYCVEKGSITIDGVSLTINEIRGSQATLMIIPHTWQKTILNRMTVAQKINIEFDILAKYTEKLLQRDRDTSFFNTLQKSGFLKNTTQPNY